MLIELPNGIWIDPMIVCGLRIDNDQIIGACVAIDARTGMTYSVPFKDAATAMSWRREFAGQINRAVDTAS